MSAALEAFCEYLTIIKGLAPKTIGAYRHDLELIEEMSHESLLKIDTAMIVKHLSTIENKRTLNRKLSALNSFLDFCHKVEFDPAMRKFRLSKLPQTLPKYLSYETIMESLSVIDKSDWLGLRDYALILFLYATGARISECLNAHEDDIENEWLRIRHGKGDKERYVPVAHEALLALRSYRDACPSQNYHLWLNYRYEPLSRVSAFKIVHKYLGVSPHALRHSYATGLILGGADLRVVQELLGHASLLSTQIYTHVQKHNLRQTLMECHPMVQKLQGAER